MVLAVNDAPKQDSIATAVQLSVRQQSELEHFKKTLKEGHHHEPDSPLSKHHQLFTGDLGGHCIEKLRAFYHSGRCRLQSDHYTTNV
jgi:hypothetical protein